MMDLPERGFCPYCGAGPAVPSAERVPRNPDEPISIPELMWPVILQESTRPVGQKIPTQTGVHAGSRSATRRRDVPGRAPLIPASEWPDMYRDIVATIRRKRDRETWRKVAQVIRDEFSKAHPDWGAIDETTVARYCVRDQLAHPKDLVLER
jgi:hypothetical protein